MGVFQTLKKSFRENEPPYFFSAAALPVKPYFGLWKGHGGTHTRCSNLAKHFGNHLLRPNIIYANSSGNIRLSVLEKAKRKGARIVLNQNGVYFPAWFSGSLEKKNRELRALADLADFIIFQSEFCRQSFHRWCGEPSAPGRVVLNSAPAPSADFFRNRPEGCRAILNLNVQPANAYALLPLLTALSSPGAAASPMSVDVYGNHSADALPAAIQSQLRDLAEKKRIRLLPPYGKEKLWELLRHYHLAIHLTHNDSCPHSVIEKLAAGLPVIHVSSGGTKELVGPAGVLLPVEESYERMHGPSAESLAAALKQIETKLEERQTLARRRFDEALSWSRYVSTHEEIFEGVLLNR